MDDDFQNPRRAYRGFHPRQAASSAFYPGAPTTNATHQLFNNSSGAQWLILRNIHFISVGSLSGGLHQSAVGAISGAVQPIIPTEAGLPGQHWYIDGTITNPVSYTFPQSTTSTPWPHDYPIALIPPGWAFWVQDRTAADACVGGFFWEAVNSEEVDFDW
jgi:hypothetical protein